MPNIQQVLTRFLLCQRLSPVVSLLLSRVLLNYTEELKLNFTSVPDLNYLKISYLNKSEIILSVIETNLMEYEVAQRDLLVVFN